MSKIDTSKIQGLLIGQLIFSIIGGLLMVFSDFSGYYHYDYYNKIEIWGSIYLGSGITSSILILIVSFGLFTSAFNAYQILKEKSVERQRILTLENIAKKHLLISISVTIIGAIIFVVNILIDQTQEWWFDAGFYGALIGGILSLVFIRQITDKI